MNNISQLVLLFVMVSGSFAWFSKYEAEKYAWAPARRSAYCVETGVQCLQSGQCCSKADVCLTNSKYSSFTKQRYSTCENVAKLAASKYIKPYKKEGEPCKDSLECRDLCCREIRGHRYHYNRCGKSEDDFASYTCVLAERRTGNDVYDDLGLRK